jgi:quercetin dioxygenase-like cupin family protein
MTIHVPRTLALIGAVFAAGFIAMTAYAAITEILAVGTMAHSDEFGGPAQVTMRRLTFTAGEVLGWHYHPGVGAYTIVARGRLIVEDGCGGEQLFTAGQAFLEHPNRVHRGRNPDREPAETLQTFLVPTGIPISVSTDQMCGAPESVQECRGTGWMTFTHPQKFRSQGECVFFVAARGAHR